MVLKWALVSCIKMFYGSVVYRICILYLYLYMYINKFYLQCNCVPNCLSKKKIICFDVMRLKLELSFHRPFTAVSLPDDCTPPCSCCGLSDPYVFTVPGGLTDLTGSLSTPGHRPGTCAERRLRRTSDKQWRVFLQWRSLWRGGQHGPTRSRD